MKKWICFLFISFIPFLSAGQAPLSPPTPWLTGPLIVPQATVIPYGHFEVEAYIYCTTNTGSYDSNWNSVSADHNFFSLNPQLFFYLGLTPWMDITIIPQFSYNTTQNQNSVKFEDFAIELDFQLLNANATPYFPGIEVSVRETFPTGPYQNLNPNKLLTDQTGSGTYATTFNLALYKVYNLFGNHFLSTTISTLYTVTTPTNVNGFNTYGGGYGTKGRVLPGNTFQEILSFELTLTQNWVFAIDNVYTHVNRTKFRGDPGVTSQGVAALNSVHSSEQISFSPAIEYNFSANFGIIAGCWFSAWGRNSTMFRSGIIEFVYNY